MRWLTHRTAVDRSAADEKRSWRIVFGASEFERSSVSFPPTATRAKLKRPHMFCDDVNFRDLESSPLAG
jgi:hypothetical protein